MPEARIDPAQIDNSRIPDAVLSVLVPAHNALAEEVRVLRERLRAMEQHLAPRDAPPPTAPPVRKKKGV